MFPDDPQMPGEASYSLQSATREFQRKHVLRVLTSTDWNVAEAARILDVSRSHAYNLIGAFGLKRE
jgi:transcriptional regulator with GAF, ATPase, and Fis domain